MKRVLAMACLSVSSSAFTADAGSSACNMKPCAAGDKGATYFQKSDPYYACPTRELVDYTSFVLGLVSMSSALGGGMPNISDKTGEPEYVDGPNGRPNETRIMLDSLRTAARVRSFDQAMALCAKGAGKINVTVMNSPKDGGAIWVMNNKTKKNFWMPKSHLDKQ